MPAGGETCRFCLMLASRGFVYHSERSAGASSRWRARCRCRVVPGWDGKDSKVEGYDPDALLRRWERMESAQVIHDGLYGGGAAQVMADTEALDRGMRSAWAEFRAAGKSVDGYRESVGSFVSSLSDVGRITIDDFDKPEGKELQVAKWLADQGHDVHFQIPNTDKGSHTADILLDGESWEMKRVASSSSKKLARRIRDASEQSESIIIDLSVSKIDDDSAYSAIALGLEKGRANRIMMLRSGQAVLFER